MGDLALRRSGNKIGGHGGYEARRIQGSLNIVAYVALHNKKSARITVLAAVVSEVCS